MIFLMYWMVLFGKNFSEANKLCQYLCQLVVVCVCIVYFAFNVLNIKIVWHFYYKAIISIFHYCWGLQKRHKSVVMKVSVSQCRFCFENLKCNFSIKAKPIWYGKWSICFLSFVYVFDESIMLLYNSFFMPSYLCLLLKELKWVLLDFWALEFKNFGKKFNHDLYRGLCVSQFLPVPLCYRVQVTVCSGSSWWTCFPSEAPKIANS